MKIAKYFNYIILIVLLGVILMLTPVSAGEHPWNEDESKNDSTSVISNDTLTGDGLIRNFYSPFIGTPFFWTSFTFSLEDLELTPTATTAKESESPFSVGPETLRR